MEEIGSSEFNLYLLISKVMIGLHKVFTRPLYKFFQDKSLFVNYTNNLSLLMNFKRSFTIQKDYNPKKIPESVRVGPGEGIGTS